MNITQADMDAALKDYPDPSKIPNHRTGERLNPATKPVNYAAMFGVNTAKAEWANRMLTQNKTVKLI